MYTDNFKSFNNLVNNIFDKLPFVESVKLKRYFEEIIEDIINKEVERKDDSYYQLQFLSRYSNTIRELDKKTPLMEIYKSFINNNPDAHTAFITKVVNGEEKKLEFLISKQELRKIVEVGIIDNLYKSEYRIDKKNN